MRNFCNISGVFGISKLKEKNDNISLALITPPAYMTQKSYRNFNDFFNLRSESVYGFVLDSVQFGVDLAGSISFTLWR